MCQLYYAFIVCIINQTIWMKLYVIFISEITIGQVHIKLDQQNNDHARFESDEQYEHRLEIGHSHWFDLCWKFQCHFTRIRTSPEWIMCSFA